MDPEDVALCERPEKDLTFWEKDVKGRPLVLHTNSMAAASSHQHTEKAAWLRKTQYVGGFTKRTTDANAEDAHRGKLFSPITEDYADPAVQLAAVEQSFALMHQPPVHPVHPHLKAVNVSPFLPAFALQQHSLSHLVFDSDPQAYTSVQHTNSTPALERVRTEHALLRPLQREDALPYVEYYLPSRESAKRLYLPEDEDEPLDPYAEEVPLFLFLSLLLSKLKMMRRLIMQWNANTTSM